MLVVGRSPSVPVSKSELLAPPLTQGARVDVCIVGAGLAGMIAAYHLSRQKRSVMVLDEGPIGGVQAGFEAAHLASVIEKPYSVLEGFHGTQAARVAAQSHSAAIDTIEAIVRREHIACEFERLDGYFFAGPDGRREKAELEFEAARRAGVEGVELMPSAPIEGVAWGPVVRYPGQAQFHPIKLLAGLARAIVRAGGRIHCGVRAKSIHAGRPATLVTSAGHRIDANAIVASHPLRPDGRLEARAAPRMAHLIGLRVARGSVTRALYWDTSEPTRCVRLRSHGTGAGEVLLVGGEDPPGEDNQGAFEYDALEKWARERFPNAGAVVQRFTGQAMQAPDVFAFSSHADCDSDSVYVSTGDWGTAMTRGTIAGLVVKDFIEGADMPWAELYMPTACYTRYANQDLARDFS
jgi:glycine/D-amino acid oxidase-like deaminating enzyme